MTTETEAKNNGRGKSWRSEDRRYKNGDSAMGAAWGGSGRAFGVIVWVTVLTTERRRQSRRTPKVLGGFVG